MNIDYTTEALDDDFDVNTGVSYAVQGKTLKAMGFVSVNCAWKIIGLSAEERNGEIILSVLCSGNSISNNQCQHRISARVQPINPQWNGTVRLIVKEPTLH